MKMMYVTNVRNEAEEALELPVMFPPDEAQPDYSGQAPVGPADEEALELPQIDWSKP